MPRHIKIRLKKTGEVLAVVSAEAHRLIENGLATLAQYRDKMFAGDEKPKRGKLGKGQYGDE